MMNTYTREQIKRGDGFLTSGEHTVIYRRPDGLYATAAKSDMPGTALELVGGGRLLADGTPSITWCD